MTPSRHKKRSDEINDAVKNTKVDMSALFRGGDPFVDDAGRNPKRRFHSDIGDKENGGGLHGNYGGCN